jgi:hypothetical protein
MGTRWRLLTLWACFLARLTFYAAALPLWEGYDEWAHFSVVRTVAQEGKFLVPRDQEVPRRVEASLQLAPVPWELRTLPPPAVTQDGWWQLSSGERAKREAAFRNLPSNGMGTLPAYEALQPPLYYWLMAPVVRMTAPLGLASQVMAVRWASVLIASLAIPLIFSIARMFFKDDRAALGCAAVAAVMPGFALDVARVGNDCLAVVLFSAFTLLLLKQVRGQNCAVGLGVVLGLGLLTKAYFLTAILALLFLAVRGPLRAAAVALACAASIGGWWYARNLITTGTLSGLSEAVMLRNTGPFATLRSAFAVPWGKAIDSVVFSHLYFGGWSSLTVRSWMYHVFYAAILVAIAGLLWRKPEAEERQTREALLWVYGAFWLGQCYNVILIYLSKGVPTSMGWYLYAVIGAEVVLCIAGLKTFLGRWAAAAGVLLFALLDLYTMHAIAIPYYTGLIRHKANGALSALHPADLHGMGLTAISGRLAIFKPPMLTGGLLPALWALYLAGTIVIVYLAVDRARQEECVGQKSRA